MWPGNSQSVRASVTAVSATSSRSSTLRCGRFQITEQVVDGDLQELR